MNDQERCELNVWLAEHLFGFVRWTDNLERGKAVLMHPTITVTNLERCGAEVPLVSDISRLVPNYCGKDWSAVAEAMAAEGCHVTVTYLPNGHERGRCYAIAEHRKEQWGTWFYGDSPGEALALSVKAALKAEGF